MYWSFKECTDASQQVTVADAMQWKRRMDRSEEEA
jgi:hypothetical protein